MSREIRFRAWDKTYNWMVLREDANQQLAAWLDSPDVFEVMQYIDQKDRNGTDIFEGDVLIVERPEQDGFIGVVEYADSSFYLHLKPGFSAFYPNLQYININPNEVRVLGNMHENPELLKK